MFLYPIMKSIQVSRVILSKRGGIRMSLLYLMMQRPTKYPDFYLGDTETSGCLYIR